MDALLAKYDLAGDPSIKRYTDYRQMLSENEFVLASIATGERTPMLRSPSTASTLG